MIPILIYIIFLHFLKDYFVDYWIHGFHFLNFHKFNSFFFLNLSSMLFSLLSTYNQYSYHDFVEILMRNHVYLQNWYSFILKKYYFLYFDNNFFNVLHFSLSNPKILNYHMSLNYFVFLWTQVYFIWIIYFTYMQIYKID
jgi:hypothetical protein